MITTTYMGMTCTGAECVAEAQRARQALARRLLRGDRSLSRAEAIEALRGLEERVDVVERRLAEARRRAC